MDNKNYTENIRLLSQYYNVSKLLNIENFIPDYILPKLQLPFNEADITSTIIDIDKKLQRDWKYHNSFLKIVDIVAELGTCVRRQVGAVLIKNRRILAAGFNGTPPGTPHCNDEICPGRNSPSGSDLSLCSAVHAEENCLIYCAKYGVSASDSVLYCSCEPCDDCMKLVETVGIKMVIYNKPYPTKMSELHKYFSVKSILFCDLRKEYENFSRGRIEFT